jgi:hypothetical protein
VEVRWGTRRKPSSTATSGNNDNTAAASATAAPVQTETVAIQVPAPTPTHATIGHLLTHSSHNKIVSQVVPAAQAPLSQIVTSEPTLKKQALDHVHAVSSCTRTVTSFANRFVLHGIFLFCIKFMLFFLILNDVGLWID